MSRVDLWENVCYRFLDERHRNEGFLIGDLIAGVQAELGVTLRNNANLRKALLRCRERALSEGKFLPYPCWNNGQTWAVTDDPNMVYDSMLHCWKEQAGWQRAGDNHSQFVQGHRRQLPRRERRVLDAVEQFRETQRQQDEVLNQLIGVVMEERREERHRDRNGQAAEPG